MHISSQRVGENQFTDQLQIRASLDLPVELKVAFYSSSRDTTSFEIFDQFGVSMGRRRFQYGMGLCSALVEDLNVLLEEFDIQIQPHDFAEVAHIAHRICDGRYGNGIEGGDAVITIH